MLFIKDILIFGAMALATSFGLVTNVEQEKQIERIAWEQQELHEQVDESTEEFGSVTPVGGIPYYLYGSGVGATDTSITLTDFDMPTSGYGLRMTDFGDIGYMTLEPGNVTRQEFISFTGVTQNSDDTATITGVTRGLSPVTPYTASSTLRKPHGGGTAAILSNPPQLYNLFANKSNDETITGDWSTTQYPTASTSLATRGYVLDVVQGTSTLSFNRIIVAGTAGETIAGGQIVFFDTTQDEWMLADASVAASSTQVLLGVAQGAGTNGTAINSGVLLFGLDYTNIGGTAGNEIYISDTAGATSTSAGTVAKKIGIIRSSSEFYFDPYLDTPALSATQTWTGNNTFSSTSTFSGGFVASATSSASIGSFPAWQIGKFQQVFTNSGTFTVPDGIKRVWVIVQGGGEGGADGTNLGDGGDAGAYCEGPVDVSATSSVAVSIGTGGGEGVAGTASTFSTFVNAGGGNSGGGDCTGSSVTAGAFIELENLDGGTSRQESGADPDIFVSGNGGDTPFGRGGQGSVSEGDDMGGLPGTGYGTGGGGTDDLTAGDGMPGIVIVRW